MAIKRIFQHVSQDLSAANITLPARANRGYRILDIGGTGAGSGQGLVVTVDDTRMLFAPCVNAISQVCFPKFISEQTMGFYEMLRATHPTVPYIIAGPDQEVVIERANTAGACTGYVWYEELTGDDIPDPADPGGSRNTDRIICQLSQESWTVAAGATETEEVTDCDNPAGFYRFPFEEVIPTNRRIQLLGLVCGYDNSGSGNTTVNGVRMWVRDESILAPDEDFCPYETFPPLNTGADQRLCLFREPIDLPGGDEIRIEYNFTNAGGGPESPLMGTVLICRQLPLA